MKRFKILLAAILTLVAVITVTGVSYAAWVYTDNAEQSVNVDSGAWDAESTNTYNLEYEGIYGDNGHVSAYRVVGLKSAMIGSIIRIPSTHNDLPVTNIASSFCENEKLLLFKLVIPASIVEIEADALSYLNMLNTLVIEGNRLLTIGDRAFSNCNSLIKVELPSSIKTIGQDVLTNCVNIKNINVHTSKSNINNGAEIKNFGLKSDNTLPEIVFAKETV